MTSNSFSKKLLDLKTPIGGLLLFPGEIYISDEFNSEKELRKELVEAGWLEANGETIKKNDYPELFEAISDTYNTGFETNGYFSLPDMRNSIPQWDTYVNQNISQNLEEASNYLFGVGNMVMYFLIKAR